MFDKHTVELDWGGRKLTLETGRMARQADGAVLATYGETTVLAVVVAAKAPKEGVDFLPLTVNYTEKYYAAGRIPGGYFKRERGPTEKDTLTSRLIDRPIRPLFADGWRCDTQVTVTVLSHDMENGPEIVAMVAATGARTAKEPRELVPPDHKALEKEILGRAEKDLRAAYSIVRKQDRQDAVTAVKEKVMAHFFPEGTEPTYDKLAVAGVFKELEAKIVRWNILDTHKTIDGRDLKTVRPIVAEVGVLPRTHGSALFTRGETQALVVATLGTSEDEQFVDALQGTYKET